MTDNDIANDPVFPPEIFAVIISNLAELSDKSGLTTLQRCSLTSKSFAALCRPYTFREVELGFHIHRGKTPLHRLAKLIAETPILAECIRNVTFTTHPVCVWEGSQSPHTWFEGDKLRLELELEDSLGYTFLNLPNVQELYMCLSIHSSYKMVTMDDFGHRMFLEHYVSTGQLTNITIHGPVEQLPLIPLFSSPKLERLEITDSTFEIVTTALDHVECLGEGIYCSVPVSLLASPKSIGIKDLTLVSCAGIPPAILSQCKQLNTLRLEYVTQSLISPSAYFRWNNAIVFNNMHTLDTCTASLSPFLQSPEGLLSSKLFPVLKSLSVYCNLYEDSVNIATTNLLFDHVHDLEELCVDNTFLRISNLSALRLPELIQRPHTSLKNITIKWRSEDTDGAFTDQLCDVLERIRNQNSIQSLCISIFISRKLAEDLQEIFDTSDEALCRWRRLDDLLTQNGFPLLKHVKVHVEVPFGTCISSLEQNIVRQLKNLAASPYIRLECAVQVDIL